MSKPTLVLVDGSSYLYRAFHALPNLATSTGQPTGAIHGVVAMLKKLKEESRAEFFAVVFDPRGKTHRDRWFPAYKAQRPSMPAELASQVPLLFQVIEALGLPQFVVDGIEADDVIGTLARQAAAAGYKVVISTGDKDLAQLVNEDIHLVNTMDDSRLDPAGVLTKFGVAPDRIVDYLTLVGDTVDNIPGVPKVGPKTAVKWLTQYGSLDAIIANAAAITGAVGENLRGALAQLPLSKQLVTILDQLDLNIPLASLAPRDPDTAKLQTLYQQLEFKTWSRQLAVDAPSVTAGASSDATHYDTILTRDALDQWLTRLSGATFFAFDTETTSLNYIDARIVGVSFACDTGAAAYIPLAHDYLDAPTQLARDEVLAALKPLLEDPARLKLGHNLKYDCSVLRNHGIELQGIRHDSMLESYVLNSVATRHDLDSLALKYLAINTIHFEDVAGKGTNQITFNKVPVERAAIYAAEDADVCLKLHEHFWPKLQDAPKLRQLYEEIEIPLVPVLSRVEYCGVMVDAAMLCAHSAEMAAELVVIEQQAHAIAGAEFNIGSPKQIQEILFDKMGLPVTAKTPTGQPSTAESALQELAEEYPLPKLILEHRTLSKLKSTYTDKLPAEINPSTGRIHTSYHQAVAATGRLSSSDPNLQNIPIRTAAGRRIRKAFIAPAGTLLVAADYSQIELRIMAHLSQDERLLAAFAAGTDIHRATAAEVFGRTPEMVDDDQRRAAKAINFGLIYGMSAFGLARQLGIERGAAQAYVDLYFARYPGVRRFMEGIRTQAREQGYVETVFGRRLFLPDINSRNVQRRQYAERTAINAPMQGTAADIIKRAMIAVDRWILEARPAVKLIMQVHDELVFEVAEAAISDAVARIREIMSQAAALAVPLVVDIGVGANWDEAH
ncbi:MAG: DNA polymerase I [Gammaproteobacteria bacterium]|nr:DNA polymerase I [Gammaproteobacteria bacterium]